MTTPFAAILPTGLVVVDAEPTDCGPQEMRYDLDIIPVDAVSGIELARLRGGWQYENSKLRVERIVKETV